jgi:hypothetical protein
LWPGTVPSGLDVLEVGGERSPEEGPEDQDRSYHQGDGHEDVVRAAAKHLAVGLGPTAVIMAPAERGRRHGDDRGLAADEGIVTVTLNRPEKKNASTT